MPVDALALGVELRVGSENALVDVCEIEVADRRQLAYDALPGLVGASVEARGQNNLRGHLPGF